MSSRIESVLTETRLFPPSQAFIKQANVTEEGYGKLVAEAERVIDLLQERRTALISAAVTGQIDVRGTVASSVTRPKKRHA